MQTTLHIHSEKAIKLLGEPTRQKILRHLLTEKATISQMGLLFGRHPAQIRYHIIQLEKVGLVELFSTQKTKNYQEKYYRAKASAFFLSMAVFPNKSEQGQFVLLGSDDSALNLLVELANKSINSQVFFNFPVGSLDGLIYLREGFCQISGTHLYDENSGDFNLPFVRLLFSNQKMAIITIAHREQGILVGKGNPYKISSINDIIRNKLRYINRQNGAGTRMRLDQLLRKEGFDPSDLIGYVDEVLTHEQVGEYVAQGKADVGLAIESVAHKYNLDFVPLFKERYDLVMTNITYQTNLIKTLIETLHSTKFKDVVKKIGGYDLEHSGEIFFTG
jgi:putative molybdopterin biosynthesis protein